MSEIPRLNGIIKILEQGKTAFVSFTPADIESAIALASSNRKGGLGHIPTDTTGFGVRYSLNLLLDQKLI